MFTKTSVPFLISSLFQYVESNGSKEHFFPRPLADPPELEETKPSLAELQRSKKSRKIRIISHSDFSAVIQGNKLCLYSAARSAIQQFQSPHSAINRLTGSVEGPRFFYTEECLLPSNSKRQTGFFFCVKCRENEEFTQNLKTVFYFLADTGIGGGASVGKGHIRSIEVAEDYLPYDEPKEETSHFLTLSLTFPNQSLRQLLSHSWYELEKRQGKIECMYAAPASGHIWKDHLLMLKEGSTFPANGQPLYGENRIVRKDDGNLGFDVQHYGYAFTVKTKHADRI